MMGFKNPAHRVAPARLQAVQVPRPGRGRPGRGPRRLAPVPCACTSSTSSPDILVIGAGITGLAISLELLRASPSLTVACLDGAAACPGGATGAGQGYLWLAHRHPTSPAWSLARRSRDLWPGWLDPGRDLGWRDAGSTLLATREEGGLELEGRAAALTAAGVPASVLSARELAAAEPALALRDAPRRGPVALRIPSDAQLSGRAAARALRASCLAFGARFRLTPGRVASIQLQEGGGSVRTARLAEGGSVTARKGIVVAAGAWSGTLLAASCPASLAGWGAELAPRRGLLLDLPWPRGLPLLDTGVMEVDYSQHYTSQASGPGEAPPQGPDAARHISISFTATRGPTGRLLLGSSREFSEYDTEDGVQAVADAILARGRAFLSNLPLRWEQATGAMSVGLRPYAVRGLPHIGPLPGHEGLWLAAGHEGSGLLLAPAGAELACAHILGKSPGLEGCDAFLPHLPTRP